MTDIFCIASGPSLTKADCDLVARSGAKICCVNNAWEMFDQIDCLYAGDLKWWNAYGDQIDIPIKEKWTCTKSAAREFGLNLHKANGPFNSGMRAVQWAIQQGYKSIALLGYDCSIKEGSHFHGEHTFDKAKPLSPQKVKKWHLQFLKVERQACEEKAKIYNCSRHTELACFPVMKLEDVL